VLPADRGSAFEFMTMEQSIVSPLARKIFAVPGNIPIYWHLSILALFCYLILYALVFTLLYIVIYHCLCLFFYVVCLFLFLFLHVLVYILLYCLPFLVFSACVYSFMLSVFSCFYSCMFLCLFFYIDCLFLCSVLYIACVFPLSFLWLLLYVVELSRRSFSIFWFGFYYCQQASRKSVDFHETRYLRNDHGLLLVWSTGLLPIFFV
jgi:hypothetical protein